MYVPNDVQARESGKFDFSSIQLRSAEMWQLFNYSPRIYPLKCVFVLVFKLLLYCVLHTREFQNLKLEVKIKPNRINRSYYGPENI